MKSCTDSYQALQRWLVFAGLALLALFLLAEQGLLQALIEADRSRLSIVILIAFGAASAHAGWHSLRISREICDAQNLLRHCRKGDVLFEQTDDGIQVAGAGAGSSHAHEHLSLVYEKSLHEEGPAGQDLLLERLDQRVRGGHQSGWFVADLMLKLGLLGTVIGFIFMLGSITGLQQLDIKAMQHVLTSMSGGMQVALYTTLTGLVAGMLLGLQYQILERAADRLLGLIIEIGEVHLPRHLPNTNNGQAARARPAEIVEG